MVEQATYALFRLPFFTYFSYSSWWEPLLPSLQSLAIMPSLMALCVLLLPLGSTPLTCVPLAAVQHIPSAAHLLPFRFVLRLHLLTGHVPTEASLDLGSSPVGLRVIQGDVHDVLLLVGPAAILLQRGTERSRLSQKGGHIKWSYKHVDFS